MEKESGEMSLDLNLKRIKILELPTGTKVLLVRTTARQAEVLGSNPSECQICELFCRVLSSVLT